MAVRVGIPWKVETAVGVGWAVPRELFLERPFLNKKVHLKQNHRDETIWVSRFDLLSITHVLAEWTAGNTQAPVCPKPLMGTVPLLPVPSKGSATVIPTSKVGKPEPERLTCGCAGRSLRSTACALTCKCYSFPRVQVQ